MAFDPSPVSDARVRFGDGQLYVEWSSSAPPGAWYQVYCNRELAWSGTVTGAHLPWPIGPCQIDIGAVDSGADAVNDYSGTLSSGHPARAELRWEGGSFQGPSIDHFAIYSASAPGGPVSYARPVARVSAYDSGIPLDGWGMGGFGVGGFGHAASSYTWRSGVLAPGTWNLAVDAVDVAGNASGSPALTSVTISAPPRPPRADADGVRLHGSVSAPSGWGVGGYGVGGYGVGEILRYPVLAWSASP